MDNFDIKKSIDEIKKTIKLMKKEALVENFDDLKRLLRCRTTNECIVTDDKGKRQWYRHPDLDEFSKQAYEKGQEYFYVKSADKNDPYGKQILCEPEYEYFLKRPLTKEEFDNLFGICNEREQSDKAKVIIEAELSDSQVEALNNKNIDISYPFATNVTLDYGDEVVYCSGKIQKSYYMQGNNNDRNQEIELD